MAVRPLLISSSKKRVGFLKRTAVRALPTETIAPSRERSVEAFQRHQVSAFIDDGNNATGRVVLLCVINRSCDDFFRAFEIERFLFDNLGMIRPRSTRTTPPR